MIASWEFEEASALASLEGTWVTEGWLIPDEVELGMAPSPEDGLAEPIALEWRLGTGERKGLPGPRMLDEFVALSDTEEAADIRDYARRWGVLWVTECVLDDPFPRSGSPDGRRHPHDPVEGDRCQPRLGRSWSHGWETLDAWRRHSRRARAMLSAISGLRSEPPTFPSAEWELIGGAEVSSREEGWAALNAALEVWIAAGGVQLVPRLTNGRGMRFRGDGLYAAIGLEVMRVALMERAGPVAICSNCGLPYVREQRRPSPNKRNYCTRQECQRARWRDAKRATRGGK